MARRYIISLTGANRVGVLAAVTTALDELRGNLWEASISVMPPYCSILLAADFPEDRTADIVSDHIRDLCRPYDVKVRLTEPAADSGILTPPSAKYVLTVRGSDKPGMLRLLSTKMAELGVDIRNLYAERCERDQTFSMELELAIPASLVGKKLQGLSLTEISAWLDTVMTYWDTLGVDNPKAYDELESFVENVLRPINEEFSEPISPENSMIDTTSVTTADPRAANKKNPYAVRLKGVKTATESGILQFIPRSTPSARFIVQGIGDFDVPSEFSLSQNYPNPFNPSTVIRYTLSGNSSVTLKIYNTLGQEVVELLNNEAMDEGEYELTFDASALSSGLYFYRISGQTTSEDGSVQPFSDVKKMLLVK